MSDVACRSPAAAAIKRLSDLRQIEALPVPFQHRPAQSRVLREAQTRVTSDQRERVTARLAKSLPVGDHVSKAQLAQPMLARAEEFTAAAQPGVLLGE
jgi:hypothetical protein